MLFDFGASRVKTVLWDDECGEFLDYRSAPPPAPSVSEGFRYEIPLQEIKAQFLEITSSYLSRYTPIESIGICSQMHGFALLNDRNEPLTDYISWKDERSRETVEDRDTYGFLEQAIGEKFFHITGMKPRPGLPFMNAAHLLRLDKRLSGSRLVSIPEWIACCGEKSERIVHPTMIGGSGFFDLRQRLISESLLKWFFDFTGSHLAFSDVSDTLLPAGYVSLQGQNISILNGVGDFPCAVLGAGNRNAKSLSVNIGTGSQVSVIGQVNTSFVEFRPFFGGEILSAITHIPAGRVLNEIAEFYHSIIQAGGGVLFDFWNRLSQIEENDVAGSTLSWDLAFFQSAWNYSGGGSIENIAMGSLNLKNFFGSLLKSFVGQYKGPVRSLDPEGKKEILLSGGVPRKLRHFRNIFSKIVGNPVALSQTNIDETFLGLKILLSEQAGGNIASGHSENSWQ